MVLGKMQKGLLKNSLMVLLVSITIFSVLKYVTSLKEKYDLLNSLEQTKEQVATLEEEKQNLSQTLEKEKELQQKVVQQNSALKDYLRASKERLTELFADYRETQETIEQLDSKVSLLKAENTALTEEKERVTQENEDLEAKISSIVELRKAIRELRRQMRKVGVELKQKVTADKIREGNRGFLLKDGQPTSPAKVKIEVIPAPKKE